MVRRVTDTTLFTWSLNSGAVYLTTCFVLLHLTQASACRSVRLSVMPRWGQHYSRHWNLKPPAGHTSVRYPLSITNRSEPTDCSWTVPVSLGFVACRFDWRCEEWAEWISVVAADRSHRGGRDYFIMQLVVQFLPRSLLTTAHIQYKSNRLYLDG